MNFLQNGGAKEAVGIANTGIFGLLGMGLFNFVKDLKDRLKDFKGINGTVKEFTGTITDAVQNIVKSIMPMKDDESLGDTILKIAFAIAILAGSLILLATVPTQDLFGAVAAIGGLAGVLYLLMKSLTELNSSSSNSDGLGGLAGALFGKGKSSSSNTDIIKMSAALLMVSAGIGILAGAVKKLAELSLGDLVKGVVAVGALMFMLVKVAETLSKMEGKIVKGAGGLILFAVALRVLIMSVKALGAINPNNLALGLFGLAITLAEILAFIKLLDKEGMGVGTGVAIIALAAGLLILTKSISALGEMDSDKLALGLFGVAVALAAIVGFSHLVQPKGLLKTGIAMIAMGAGLAIIANVIKKFSEMDPNNLALGLFALAGVLGEFIVFSKFTGGKRFLALSAGMVAMSTGILILSAALKVMASIPIAALFVSLSALAGVFIIVGVASAVLKDSVLVILGLAGAMALLGIGVVALSIGLASLGVSMVSFATCIVDNIALIIQCFVALVGGILDAIGILIPKLVEVGMALIMALLQGIADNIEGIIVAAVAIISNFILGIAESLSMIIEAGIVLILALITGIAQGLQEHGPELVAAVIELIKSILSLLWEMVTQSLGFIADAFNWIVEKLGWVGEKLGIISKEAAEEYQNSFSVGDATEDELDDTVSTIESKTGDINSATNDLGQAGYDGLNNWLGEYGNLGDKSGTDYIMSIINTNTGSVAGLPEEAIEVLRAHGWEFEGVGADAGQGYVNGIYSKQYAAEKAAEDLTRSALNRIRSVQMSESPSKVTTRLGTYFGDGYVIGISKRENAAEKAAENLSSSAIDSMRGALSRVSDILGSDLDNAPTIRPVLDLSNVESGVNTIDDMFGSRSLALSGVNGSIFDSNAAYANQMAVDANKDVVNELGRLRSDVTTLSNSMSQMQVVMDSGTLVGEMINPMNKRFGQMVSNRRRGI